MPVSGFRLNILVASTVFWSDIVADANGDPSSIVMEYVLAHVSAAVANGANAAGKLREWGSELMLYSVSESTP